MTVRSTAGQSPEAQAIDELIEASRLGLTHQKEEAKVTFAMLKCLARPGLSHLEKEIRSDCAAALLEARARRKKGIKRNGGYFPLVRSEREMLKAKHLQVAAKMAGRIYCHSANRWHPYGVYAVRLLSAVGYDAQLTFRIALRHDTWTSAKTEEFKFTVQEFWRQYWGETK